MNRGHRFVSIWNLAGLSERSSPGRFRSVSRWSKPGQNCRSVMHGCAATKAANGLAKALESPELSHTNCWCGNNLRGFLWARSQCFPTTGTWGASSKPRWLAHAARAGWPIPTCWPAGPRMRSGIVVALPLTAVSSQYVIGSFEARFFARAHIRGTEFSPSFHIKRTEVRSTSHPQVRFTPDFCGRPRRRPACDQRPRSCAECAGRALSRSRS